VTSPHIVKKILELKREDAGSSLNMDKNNSNFSFNKKYSRGVEPLNDSHIYDIMSSQNMGKSYYQSVQHQMSVQEPQTKINI
jgi:hypothetical protein